METQKNTFKKFAPNVFVAKCPAQHEKGSLIILSTKYGKEVECEVFNFLGRTNDGFFLYSIQRTDGINSQERARAKAEKLKGYATNAEKRSDEAYKASHEGRDFLSLGEPIKIGHHSERRHRNLIARNWARMEKSVRESEKAEEYKARAEYWENRAEKIDLSMPESIDYFEYKLHQAQEKHKFYKENPDKREHSYSLTYANKAVKEMKKNMELAIKLWGDIDEVNQLNQEKAEEAKKKATKSDKTDELIKKYGGFFFFGNDKEAFLKEYNKLLESGHLEKGEKVRHVFAGLYMPVKNVDSFLKEQKKK